MYYSCHTWSGAFRYKKRKIVRTIRMFELKNIQETR
jgi:hypothetical protein